MSTLETALLFLCVEFALLAAALAFLQWRGGRRQQHATLANVTSLVSTVEQATAPRREALLTVLRETYRFDDEKAEQVVSDFIEREHAFYNALIGVHLGRGGKSLADVPAEVTRLVAPWLRLTPSKLVDESEVEALQTQNLALSGQLAETKQVLDDLMSEYSAAFMRGKTEPMVHVDGEAPAPAQDVTLADEDLAPAGPAPLGDVPDDELLSMDDIPDLATPETPAIAREDAAEEDFDFAQNVIDLDGDDDPVLADAPPPLSQSDLDALMDNLGLDEPSSKAVPA